MPSNINLSILPYQDYITTTTTICNNNTCYPYIQTNTSYYNYNNNNSNNPYYYQYSTRNSPSPTIDSESYDEQEEEQEEETKATCGECGEVLGPGWHCDTCRKSCPYCNRALGMDTNDYCERCFRYCDKHDTIYPIINSETQEGPKCPQCQQEKD
ncbi:hypothetical protein BDC45DRAFT_571867 [Circinella umbellata]|nr:hypothetical protein BDC45DRAFT_571867 [Circinella umbellata]